jgi:lipoprotein-releasing system permease protein
VIRYSGRDVGASIIGVDPEKEAAVSPIIDDFRQGSFAALVTGGNNVLIGDTMADRLGAKLGDTISAVSATGQTRNFKIVGLFHTGATARDEGEAYVLLKNAQILSERANAINEIRIKLDDPYSSPVVARRAEAELGYKADAWQEANESLLEALVIRNVIMYTVVAAIMLVAGFGIFNIVSTITHEKARDIAIMKSLGFQEADMRRIFLLEGVTIGMIGSLSGWIVGFSLVYALSSIRFELSAGGREITSLPVAWSFLHYVIASSFALAAAALAGYLPARKAAKVNPVDIIRGAT